MRVEKVKQTKYDKSAKIIRYLTEKYGSPIGLKLVKYFLENKLAREKKGFAVYELTFNISPSAMLKKDTLIKIQCLADDSDERDSIKSFDILLKKGIFKIDSETGGVDLGVPIESIANLYLVEKKDNFEETNDASLASVILLPLGSERTAMRRNKFSNIVGVPDMLSKERNGKWSITENKFVHVSEE